MGAKLSDGGSTGKGNSLKDKMYDKDFWRKMVLQEISAKRVSEKQKSESEKIIIIKEIVKIRCSYCGGLYDESNDRCPYCGGKR